MAYPVHHIKKAFPGQHLVLVAAPLAKGAVLGVGLVRRHGRREVARRDAADLEQPLAGGLGVGEDVLVAHEQVVLVFVLDKV